MRYGKLTGGVPVPTNTKALLNIDGVQYPPVALRDAAWRAANAIVEIQDQPYDSNHEYLGAVIGYTDLTNGVWQENNTILTYPLEQLQAITIKDIQFKREQVLRGGIVVLNKPVSTDSGDVDKVLLMDSWRKIAGNTWPVGGVSIFTLEGERVKVNETQFDTLVSTLATHFYLTDNNADAHISAVEALATQQEVIDYDITTGWPANPVVVV